MKKNKGFTLIELLAVIIILGILLTIGVVGVTRYINDSRRKTYINTATKYIDGIRLKIHSGELPLLRDDTTYYVHIGNARMEKPSPSPFGKWIDAYVGYTTDGRSGNYYWTSLDEAGHKINITPESVLKPESIIVDKHKRLNNSFPLEGKMNIIIIDKDGIQKTGYPSLELTEEEAKSCYTYHDKGNDTFFIILYDASCSKSVIIPSYIDGKKVVEIYSYAFRNKGITDVVIATTIETIGTEAFMTNKLSSVEIPPNVKTIGTNAFSGNQINELTLHEGLVTLGLRSFFRNKLTSYNIPSSVSSIGSCSFCENPIPSAEFLYATSGGKPDYSTIRGYIGDLREFPDKRFIIPAERNGVKLQTIQSSFIQNLPLTDWEVVIPDTVTSIGASAFYGVGLKKVNLPDGLKSIGTAAFYVNRISELKIPNSVTSIGNYAFNNNQVINPDEAMIYKRTATGVDYSSIIGYAGQNRTDVVLPPTKNGFTLKRIESHAFAYVSLRGNLVLPNSVDYIAPNAFSRNYIVHFDNGDGKLAGPFIYKRLPNGGYDDTRLIGYAALGGVVTIPSQVKYLESHALHYTSITEAILPEGLLEIGPNSFSACNLNKAEIPSTVTSIGLNAYAKTFHYNKSLMVIKNNTGKSYNWRGITGAQYPAEFETGLINNWYGNIEIIK